MRVSILTNFQDVLKSYSPLIIVSQQIKQFKNAGYEPTVIVAESFFPEEGSVFFDAKLARIPNVSVSTEAKQDPSFESDIEFLKYELRKILAETDVMITHDLIFLPDYVKHRVACLELAEEFPNVKWLHWVHSATNPSDLINERKNFEDKYREMLGQKFPNSLIVFPNTYDIPRVARNFGYEEDEVVCVPHPIDYEEFNKFEPITRRLCRENRILEADVIMVYPLRLDRGKQPHINISIAKAIKDTGLDVRLIFADFQSTGDDKVVYREEMKKQAFDLDLVDEVIFLSEFDDASSMESPQSVVSDLFTLSNVFVLPSMSETYSLVAQEALSKGNFLILNHDFAPMRSIYGDMAIYKQFSGKIGFDGLNGEITTKYSDPEGYYHDIACYVRYMLNTDKVLKGKTWVRKERNLDSVFRNYLEPLIFEEELCPEKQTQRSELAN